MNKMQMSLLASYLRFDWDHAEEPSVFFTRARSAVRNISDRKERQVLSALLSHLKGLPLSENERKRLRSAEYAPLVRGLVDKFFLLEESAYAKPKADVEFEKAVDSRYDLAKEQKLYGMKHARQRIHAFINLSNAKLVAIGAGLLSELMVHDQILYSYERKIADFLRTQGIDAKTDEALSEAVKSMCKDNWQFVNSNALCYTAQPEHEVTQLFCELAHDVAAFENGKRNKTLVHPITVLMPGVATVSLMPEKYHDLTMYPGVKDILVSHISGRHGYYLIPVKLCLDLSVTDDKQTVYNVFDLEGLSAEYGYYSQTEIARLKKHSQQIKEYFQLCDEYSKSIMGKTSLLTELRSLLDIIIRSSKVSEGEEVVAGESVYAKSLRFLSYWDQLGKKGQLQCVPKELIAEINKFKQLLSGNTEDGHESRDFDNVHQNSETCLGYRRAELTKFIRRYETQLSGVTLGDAEIKEKNDTLLQQIEVFQKEISRQFDLVCNEEGIFHLFYTGKDTLGVTSNVLSELSIALDNLNTKSLVSLMNGLNSDELMLFLDNEAVSDAIKRTVSRWNLQDLMTWVIGLSAQAIEQTKQLTQGKFKALVTNESSLILILDMCASPLKANALLRANLDIVKRLIHSEASLKYILNSRYVSCVIKVLECELKKIIKTPSTFCAITDALQEHSPYDAKQFFTDNQSLLFDLILHSHRDLYSDFTLDNDYSSFKLAIGRYTSSMSYLFEQRSSGIVPKTEQPQLIFSYIEHVKVKIESSRFSALYLFFLVTLTDEYLADRFQQFSSLKSSLLQQAGSYLLNESTGVISCSELVALLSCYSQEKQFEMIDNLINRKKPLSLVGDKETLFSYALQPHYDKVAQAFEEKALASGHRPKEEPLDLSDNSSGDKGAQALAKALTSGNCPSGLKLDISSNEIGDKGAQAFAKALASGHRPKGEPSDLSDNSSGNKGAEALARALESGQCPSGLKLELNTDDIYPKSYKAFQAALESGKRQSWEKLDVREDLSSIDSLPDLFFMMMRLMIRSADDFVCVTERLCLSKGVLKKIIKESGSYIIDTIRTFDQLNVVLDSMDEKQQEDTLSNNMSLIIDHVSDLYTYDEASELCKEHSSLMHRLYVGVRSSLNLWLTDDPDDMGCGDFNDELFIEVYSSLGRDDQQDWFETHMGALVETLKSLPDATTDDCSYDSDDDFGVSFIGLFVDVFPHLNPKDQDTLLSDESICTKVIADSENRSEVLTYVQASLNAKGGQGHTGGELSLFASSTQYVNLESFKRRLEETQSKELAEGKLSL